MLIIKSAVGDRVFALSECKHGSGDVYTQHLQPSSSGELRWTYATVARYSDLKSHSLAALREEHCIRVDSLPHPSEVADLFTRVK